MSNNGFARHTLAPLVLRVALAVIFIYHGLGKIIGTDNNWGAAWAVNAWRQQTRVPKDVMDKLEHRLEAAREKGKKDKDQSEGGLQEDKVVTAKTELEQAYGMQDKEKLLPPEILGYHAAQLAVAWGELLGGFALLVGLLTRLAAIGLLIIQVGAILTVTAARNFSFAAGGGYEYNIALIAMCLTLVFLGGGALAADNVLFKRGGAPAGAPARV